MARQGSLCQPKFRIPFSGLGWRSAPTRWLLALLLAVGCSCLTRVAVAEVAAIAPPSQSKGLEAADLVDAWFRIQWSAAEPTAWHLRLAIDSDQASEWVAYENHCTSDGSTGAFSFLAGQSALAIDTREKSDGGAVRVRIRVSRGALLTCRLVPSNESETASAIHPIQIRVADLLSAASSVEQVTPATTNSPAVTWSVQRTPNDALRVDLKKPSTIYSADEPLQFSLGINSLESHRGSDVTLRYTLRRVDDGVTVATQSWDLKLNEFGSASPIDVTATPLTQPGVYELRGVVETKDDGIWNKFRRHKELLVESGQAVLVTGQNTESTGAENEAIPWRVIATIRPSESRQWTLSGFVPATTDVLLSTIQPNVEATLSTQTYANQSVSTLTPGASCEFKLPVDKTGQPHVVSVRYPAGVEAQFRLDVHGSAQPLLARTSFAINDDATGIDHSAWTTHSFVYFPGGRDETIRLTNLDAKRPVSFHSIQVTAGPKRLIGVSSKARSNETMVAFSLRDLGWVEQLTSDFDSRADSASYLAETRSLHRLSIATSRLADYVRASGMNSVVVPANQGGRAWFETAQFSRRFQRPSESAEQLATFLHLMDDSGLDVIVGLEPTMPLTSVEQGNHAAGDSFATSLRSNRSDSVSGIYHPLHSQVRESLEHLIADINRTSEGHVCFKGLSLTCTTNSHLAPLTGNENFAPSVLARFIQSTSGLPQSIVPQSVNPPNLLMSTERRRQFDGWRRGEGRGKFDEWLIAEQRQFLQRLASRGDHMLLMRLPAPSVSLVGGSGLCSESWPPASANLYPIIEHQRAAVGELSRSRAASLRLGTFTAIEPTHSRSVAIALSESVPADRVTAVVIHESLALDLSRLVDRLQPRVVLIDCSVVTGSISAKIASALRSIATAPMGRMERVNTVDAGSHPVRLYQDKMGTGLLAINMAPWTTQIDITVTMETRWLSDADSTLLTSEALGTSLNPIETWASNGRSFRLAAGEIKWLRTDGSNSSRIVDWTTRPAGGEEGLQRVNRAVTQIVERLGSFSEAPDYASLANGGFEQSSAIGIVGWLAAQHPPDAVRIDSESIEGKQSVCLTTDPRNRTRTWLVSETIAAPISGRLAVAMACRGELSQLPTSTNSDTPVERAPGRLRIAIEGTRNGEPVRFATEIDVPRDGRWQPRRIVLELDGLEPSETQSLRLAIDSLTPGKIWIDDVHLHDWFPLESERNDLQGQSFLAVQGLQRGSIAPAARLIRNDWARYLLNLQVSPQSPIIRKPASVGPSIDQPANDPNHPPGMADRFRSWLSRPLRF